MVSTRRAAAAERARAAGIAFSKLSGDEQGVILGQLRNALEPRPVMYFSSANKELRALLPPAVQLSVAQEAAEALGLSVAADPLRGERACMCLRGPSDTIARGLSWRRCAYGYLSGAGCACSSVSGLLRVCGMDGVRSLPHVRRWGPITKARD